LKLYLAALEMMGIGGGWFRIVEIVEGNAYHVIAYSFDTGNSLIYHPRYKY
jgi:hypothetical protein